VWVGGLEAIGRGAGGVCLGAQGCWLQHCACQLPGSADQARSAD
jgi:hypothetical protein